jgi:hypothetical protein
MFLIDALVRVQPSGQRAGLGWAGHPFHTMSFSGLLDMQFWSIGLCIRVYFPGVGRRAYLGEVSRLKKKKKKMCWDSKIGSPEIILGPERFAMFWGLDTTHFL